MKTTDDCIRIAAAGGGLDLRNASKTTEDLIRIASAASRYGATVMVKGSGKTTDDCIRIASAGKGSVTFYFE